MRLLIYIEPTSYLMPLWREIKARSSVETRLIFVEENLSQQWNFDLQGDPHVEVLRGSRAAKLARLWQLLRQRDVRLLDLAGWGHPLLMATLLLAWLHRIPVTMESDTQYDSTVARWRRALKRLVLPALFRIPRRFLAAGTRQAAYFMRYGVNRDRICIAQMTVDVRSLMEQVERHRVEDFSASCRHKPTVFLYVGRLEGYKGVQDLLDAFVALPAEDGQARLIIVGDGSLRARVEGTAHGHPAIDYLGRLSGEALFRAYACADVFVLPSRAEPWGLVVNEAMAAGLPVIVTDRVGCVDDLVRDGENGCIVPAANRAHLTRAMYSFVRQPEMVAAMGRMSRQIISGWTIEDEAQIMLDAWSEIA